MLTDWHYRRILHGIASVAVVGGSLLRDALRHGASHVIYRYVYDASRTTLAMNSQNGAKWSARLRQRDFFKYRSQPPAPSLRTAYRSMS